MLHVTRALTALDRDEWERVRSLEEKDGLGLYRLDELTSTRSEPELATQTPADTSHRSTSECDGAGCNAKPHTNGSRDVAFCAYLLTYVAGAIAPRASTRSHFA